MAAPTVAVVGMAALRRDIRRMSDDQAGPLYAAIKAAGRAAADPVAARASSSVARDTGALAGSIRVSATRTGAAVRMGRATVPYAGWVEFGGTRPDGSERTYMPAGRYLFPAAQGLAPVSAEAYARAMSTVFNSDRVWTNTTDNPEAIHD